MELLNRNDVIFSHHRSHGYYLAKHGSLTGMIAEFYGKEIGVNGGLAGSAQGIAYVELIQLNNDDITILSYSVDASVNGKLAQLGSRLIESTAKKLAKKFFEEFVKIIQMNAKNIIQ